MAITITDRGTFQTAKGGSITMSATSASFSVAAGTILLFGVGSQVLNGTGGSSDITFTASDTIGDTGGGTWTRQASCTRGAVGNGVYAERNEVWTRVIGTTPGASKTVTFTATWNNGGSGTTADGYMAAHLWENAGQHATPIGLTASPSPVTTGTTFNTDLGGVPASDSAVFGVIQDDSQGDDVGPATVPPSGWTEADEQNGPHLTFPCGYEWAFINGGSVQSPQWSGMISGDRFLGAAVEIKAAAVASFDPPLSRPILQYNVHRM